MGKDEKGNENNAHSATGGTSIVPDMLINASGHVQELQRNFSLLSLIGLGIVVGNVWPAAGGSILVALFNGGPPGIIYSIRMLQDYFTNWLARRSLRIHRCKHLLLDCGRIHRRAGKCHPLVGRRIPLGISNSWKALGTC